MAERDDVIEMLKRRGNRGDIARAIASRVGLSPFDAEEIADIMANGNEDGVTEEEIADDILAMLFDFDDYTDDMEDDFEEDDKFDDFERGGEA